MRDINVLFVMCLASLILLISILPAVSAATTSLHIARYATDGITILNETTVDYTWMEENLPVYGDGITHYYLQGPVFIEDPDPTKEEMLRWNPEEDKNVIEKDLGAVKGTRVRDLCELIGGMQQDNILVIKAVDGFSREFSYRNVYEPSPRQGPMVIAWWKADEGYVPAYVHGMRLVFLADTNSNPWGVHAMGVWDWHESAEEHYWYYYRQGNEKYPTTTGLSVQYVSALNIKPADAGTSPLHKTTPQAPTQPVRESLSLISGILALGIVWGLYHSRGKPP